MDRQLDNIESEVASTQEDSHNNNLDFIYDTDVLVHEDDELVSHSLCTLFASLTHSSLLCFFSIDV